MDKQLGYNFWKRVDSLIYNKYTVKELAEHCTATYQTLRNQRSEERVPKVYDVYLISQFLDSSMDYLYYGDMRLVNPKTKEIIKDLQDMSVPQLEQVREKISELKLAERKKEKMSDEEKKVAEQPDDLYQC